MPGNLTPKLSGLELQLDLIRNVDLYEKRLKEIKAAAQEFKDEREKLTKAKDIDRALADAIQSAEAARVALSDARSEAAHIVNQADTKASEIVGGAQARAAQIVQAANDSIADTMQQVIIKGTELENLKAEANSLVNQLDTLHEQRNGLAAEVNALEAQKSQLLEVIADKQRKLKAALE